MTPPMPEGRARIADGKTVADVVERAAAYEAELWTLPEVSS